MDYQIDGSNRIIGRLATEVALLLRGKNNPKFNPAAQSVNKVYVFNTDKIAYSGKKATQKLYRRHSGYIGGLKEETLKNIMIRDSRIVLKQAVMGMLPKNKSRKHLIKNLILYNGGK